MTRHLSALVALLLPALGAQAQAPSSLNPGARWQLSQSITPGGAMQPMPGSGATARTISVVIEGATRGSGVLVDRQGERYTVLTAWHVVSGHRPGEELAITTADGRQHQLEAGSIRRLGQVDLAVLTFVDRADHRVARIGDVRALRRGQPLIVAGFPNNGRTDFLANGGTVVANADVGIDQGYQLLYSNSTDVGMSGGPVLNERGELVGIHGRGERDPVASSLDRIVKTGINQGVPIGFYLDYSQGRPVTLATGEIQTLDDYLAQIRSLLDKPGEERMVIALADRAMKLGASPELHLYRALARWQHLQACTNAAYVSKPNVASYLDNSEYRPLVARLNCTLPNGLDLHRADREAAGLVRDVARDLARAIQLKPGLAEAYNALGVVLKSQEMPMFRSEHRVEFRRIYQSLRFDSEAEQVLKLYNKAIALKPTLDIAHYNRGLLTADRTTREQVVDLYRAIQLNPGNWKAHLGLANILRFGTCSANSGICGVILWVRDYKPNYGSCPSNVRRAAQIVGSPLLLFRAMQGGEFSTLVDPDRFCGSRMGLGLLPAID